MSRSILEIAVSPAVLEFNDGESGLHEVFRKLKIKTDRFMDIETIKKQPNLIGYMTKKTSTASINRRKLLRAKKKKRICRQRK